MRLVSTNTDTLRLQEFTTDIPEYVILSHTWLDEGEVQYDDVGKPEVQNMPGYDKLRAACLQASADGFEWIWIDTCCINKNSSAELSEAINSMYTWYWNAEICYAYLVDVPSSNNHILAMNDFVKSRWWTRGWTLQELLAPAVVEFYDSDWKRVGTKSSLISSINAITNIEEQHLLNRETIHEATIGAIFSWVSFRETTRVEDMAYCLLGLVRVNMPLLYGEGSRAFYRLQLELLTQSAEHTIFAWNPVEDENFEEMGILAPGPRNFRHAAQIRTASLPRSVAVNSSYSTHEITNRGLRISLPRLLIRRGGVDFIAILNCRMGKGDFLAIELQYISKEQYRRVLGSKLLGITSDEAFGNHPYPLYIPAESRLANSMINSSSTCTLRIGAIHMANFVSSKIDGVFLYHDDRWTPMLDPHLGRIEDRILNEDQYISIRFVVDGTSFAIVVGQYRRMTWFRLISYIPLNEMIKRLDESVHDTLEDRRPLYIQDDISWRLVPNIKVRLSGKKTKVVVLKNGQAQRRGPAAETNKAGVRWTVTTHIEEETWEPPPTTDLDASPGHSQATTGNRWCLVM